MTAASEKAEEEADLLVKIRELRAKGLSGVKLTDEEVQEGIRVLAKVRTMRSGNKAAVEGNASQALSDLF